MDNAPAALLHDAAALADEATAMGTDNDAEQSLREVHQRRYSSRCMATSEAPGMRRSDPLFPSAA